VALADIPFASGDFNVFLRPILRMGVLVCGALTGPCLLAQTAPVTAPPAPSVLATQDTPDAVIDPAVPVPPIVYRSVFGGASAGVESGTVDWRSANETVGQFRRGHVDILKWESQHEGKH
jgi:hypothetical protein